MANSSGSAKLSGGAQSVADDNLIDVEVVLAFAQKQYLMPLTVPVGCTIREAALQAFANGLVPDSLMIDNPETIALGVYGEVEEDGYRLQAGDRVELYRPLQQDPKEWRRQRAQAANQGRSAKKK